MKNVREKIAIKSPDGSLNWANFPRFSLRRHVLYRAAKRGKGAWYFCHSGDCRFDLPSPRGTLYAGTDELSGLLESIGLDWCAGKRAAVLIPELVNERQIHSYKPPAIWQLANLCHRKAAGFRVSNELADMTPYDIPREYAMIFDATRDRVGRRRFHGIRFRSRFDPGTLPRGVALFGEEGERPWVSSKVREIDDELIAELAAIGIAVEEPPASDELEPVKEESEAA
ncbi:hypothetical protein [Streptomyces mirabilis]|uniref:hypothetical protein n=1 Tax=Streptomyces mirabilis TaxID=68239 RepID=UPI0033BE4A22